MKNAIDLVIINYVNTYKVGGKMTGILVVNAYLSGEKFDALHSHLKNSAKNMNINLEIKTNEDMVFFNGNADFILFWDKDVNLARLLEKRGYRVFNSAESIALCDDKAKTYIALDGVVPQPETVIAPLTFFENTDYTAFIEKAAEKFGLPLVFKECFGSFGQQVYLCNTVEDIKLHISSKPFLLQKFIAESKGRDVRIEVVDGECVAAIKRTNKTDFRSNLTNGGTAEPYNPTQKEKGLALKACSALGLTFGGVDILGGSLVCEVNSNAHIINLLNVTGVDTAPLIFNAIGKKL